MWKKISGLAIIGIIFCSLPYMVELYRMEVLIVLLFNLILAQSYRLVNTTGDWSLSHIVVMGVGAYSSALITKLLGWPFWLSLPVSGLVTAIIGFLIVFPLLRTIGFGFFIGSFALGEFVRLIWVKFRDPFGGPRGLINIPSAEIGPIDLSQPIPFYYFCLLIAAISIWIMYRIDRSHIGDTFKAIHTDPVLCETIGIRVPRYRAMAFVIGAFFAGIAGALMAHHQGAIDPHNFEATLMVYLIIYVVVGGVETFWGATLGVIVMTVIFEITRPLEEWRPLIAGCILILFLVVMPGGLDVLLPRTMKLFRKIPGVGHLLTKSAG